MSKLKTAIKDYITSLDKEINKDFIYIHNLKKDKRKLSNKAKAYELDLEIQFRKGEVKNKHDVLNDLKWIVSKDYPSYKPKSRQSVVKEVTSKTLAKYKP